MAGGASLARRIGRPWGPLNRATMTARVVVGLDPMVNVPCPLLA